MKKLKRQRDDLNRFIDQAFTLIQAASRADSGVTAIEYGLIAALIAVAAVTVMGTVGTNLSATFNTVAGAL
jgi:pilus assembly protein Flp/PilA